MEIVPFSKKMFYDLFQDELSSSDNRSLASI